MRRLFSFVLPAALAAGSAAAQEAVAPPTPVSPLVVTATLTATPIDAQGGSLSLITAADIDAHQWRTLPEALSTVPGLNLVQTGGAGGLTSVFIRGANANHTEVVIDGVDVDDPSQNGAFDLGQALTAGVDRVEVLRGPASSLYGADALGGVINIVTADGEGAPRLTASLEGGSFAAFNQTLALRGAAGRLHYALSLAHYRTDDTPVTPADLLAPGEKALGDRYDNLSASARLGWDLAAKGRLNLTLRYVKAVYRSTGEDFDVFPAIPDQVRTRQDKQQVFARAEVKFALLGERLANTLGAAYANFQTTIQAPDEGFGAPPPVIDNGDRWKFDWLGEVTLNPDTRLVLGADANIDRLVGPPVSAAETRAGGLVELLAHPARAISLAASARYDADDRFGAKATWRIAPAWRIAATGTLIKASVGTGFKAPTLTELFVSFPDFNFFANPNLRPETSFGYDAGFEQPLAGGRVVLGATWYGNRIRDLIDTDAAGTSWVNIGRASTHGVESFIAVRLGSRLALRGDWTWTIARDDIARQELLRRPRSRASLSGTWRAGRRLRLAASLTYVGAWIDGSRDFSVPRLRASPFATVNISGDYALGRGLVLFARIDNLLDRRYQDPVGFEKPGLGVFGGVKANLGP